MRSRFTQASAESAGAGAATGETGDRTAVPRVPHGVLGDRDRESREEVRDRRGVQVLELLARGVEEQAARRLVRQVQPLDGSS